MTDINQKAAAKAFSAYWANRGYEKGESQPFWLSLLRDVFGVAEPEKYIKFEDQVKLDSSTGFIDGFISDTHVMIEQKGADKDLNKAIRQSDGSFLTPFQQAKRYSAELPYSDRPRWIVACNFREFYVYDMEKPHGDPEKIKLADLEREYYRLSFLVDKGDVHLQRETEISVKAGEVVGLLYDGLLKQYKNPEEPETLKHLNKLCVRLVFCLYAEDAGVFGKHMMFHDYLRRFPANQIRTALAQLFKVLNQKYEDRDPYLADDDPLLAAFPYVNGGLFADETVIIPPFTEEQRDLLLRRASADFDWSEISPTIFGAVFESTLNPETRRSGGMHYTSIENIHKVIDPLFLNDLKAELGKIKAVSVWKTKEKDLLAFQKKLASLEFLDPAAGSGNFLTESYLSLRRLENEVISELYRGQISMDAVTDPIQVSIAQFHGIEINDFAVTVAKTALWIAESQMMRETEEIVRLDKDFLPLKTNANIVEGNALRLDWESVADKTKLNYIMGNPPFVGKKEQTREQKSDLIAVWEDAKAVGNLDYVSGWYKKAAGLMAGTIIRTAFVSTNSITQGEQVFTMWKPLLLENGIQIIFAYRTFKWTSEAKNKAAVHCVIIGFSAKTTKDAKTLFLNEDSYIQVNHINPYLIDAPDILIPNRLTPLCDVPEIITGNQATDDGNFFFSEEECRGFLLRNPNAALYIRKAYNSQGFINGKVQYCLWLAGASPADLRKVPEIMERVDRVKQFRLASPKAATRKQAEIPTLFTEIRQPEGNYIVIPKVSSENRKYIPLGFLTPDIICNNTIKFVPNASMYHFGVLNSNVHNAWMRVVAGRLKSDYQYSNNIVYNNFPWPTPTDEQKAKIEQTAQAILDARALYPDASLADLYDELTMPTELRKAHQANDRAVMAAYGFPVKDFTESDCVAALMKMYQELTAREEKHG
ncbi:MAG: class I SAM-dependent DNA methyltransferase [Oscillospiraceae bacterium]|nr:class I SAM-dependent DNA methyltransferase [Oscillospiraceae bacterium]